MLYDPKWEAPVKADPFEIGTLIAWLEKQPADKVYDYTDPHGCLLCQYFADAGFDVKSVAKNKLTHALGEVEFPYAFDWDVSNALRHKMTFGAALDRARKVAAFS